MPRLMDEALDLAEYLPVSFKLPSERDYITFLWETFEDNYNNAKYHFAFLAYHMLMMSFIYFKIWQIRQILPGDFEQELVGFTRNRDRKCLRDNSPFTFSQVSERAILELFRLIGCDQNQIEKYKTLVDDRNNAAHANGNIYFQSQNEMDTKIHQVLGDMSEIQSNFQPIMNSYYGQFLLQSHDPDEREYPDIEDQVREVLIRGNYMSEKDIEDCVNFDTSGLLSDDRQNINDLDNALRNMYRPELDV